MTDLDFFSFLEKLEIHFLKKVLEELRIFFNLSLKLGYVHNVDFMQLLFKF
jgi:hypothetical protein